MFAKLCQTINVCIYYNSKEEEKREKEKRGQTNKRVIEDGLNKQQPRNNNNKGTSLTSLTDPHIVQQLENVFHV